MVECDGVTCHFFPCERGEAPTRLHRGLLLTVAVPEIPAAGIVTVTPPSLDEGWVVQLLHSAGHLCSVATAPPLDRTGPSAGLGKSRDDYGERQI